MWPEGLFHRLAKRNYPTNKHANYNESLPYKHCKEVQRKKLEETARALVAAVGFRLTLELMQKANLEFT